MNLNRRTSLLLLAPLLLAARPAWAAGEAAKDRAALTACLLGDYAKGVALLTELFVATKDATYIYNQGRCFEQNQRYEDAIARFQEYLRAGKRLTKAEKADAQKHIADCRELLVPQPEPPPAVPAAPPPPAPPADPAPTAVASAPAVVVPPAVAHQSSAQAATASGAGFRTAGVITAAVGGAALVAGIVLNLKVNSMADDLQKTDRYSDGKESDRKAYETLGWVSYGVGAGCVATGAVLYVLGLRSAGAGSSTVALLPTFAHGQAGAVLQGAF